MTTDTITKERSDAERRQLLDRLDAWLEMPMLALSLVWLLLFILEATGSLTPVFEAVGYGIWALFVVEFVVKLTIAPAKGQYLKRNWLTAIALPLPALRALRIARLARVLRGARAVRGLRLLRTLSSINRNMRALGLAMGRRGFGYVVALTLVVALAGAAGMYAFERNVTRGMDTYGATLWWTAMLLTSIGSESWPQTAEGRLLCLMLSLYGFAIFGYVTATLATLFIERDAHAEDAEIAGASQLRQVQAEVGALRSEMQELLAHIRRQPAP
ncbi:MAG: ion transporter [Candidatus Binatia bacterium]